MKLLANENFPLKALFTLKIKGLILRQLALTIMAYNTVPLWKLQYWKKE